MLLSNGLLFVLVLAILPTLVSAQITGSGTTNQVPKFTAATTVGNSAITESSGNVGIGTTTPGAKIELGGNTVSIVQGIFTRGGSDANFRLTAYNGSGNTINSEHAWFGMDYTGTKLAGISFVRGTTANAWMNFQTNTGTTAMTLDINGRLGIGTTTPSAALEVYGNVKLSSGSGGSITFPDATTQSTAWTGSLCGGDYAESVDVSGKRAQYEPGDVLEIDERNPAQFLKVAEPYSTAVAGIYSTKPGAVGRRQTTPKNADEVPMAMIGIVPVKVTAENGSIRPRDLLVSSSQPGYAMKGTDRNRMLGAVIGKAMGSLDSGTGVIEVLVTLQ